MSLLSIIFHNVNSSELSAACDLPGVKCSLSLKTANKYLKNVQFI